MRVLLLHFFAHHTAREPPLSVVESGGRKGRQKAGRQRTGGAQQWWALVGPAELRHPCQGESSSPALPHQEEGVKDIRLLEEKAVLMGEVYLMENHIYLKEAENSFLPIRCSRLW